MAPGVDPHGFWFIVLTIACACILSIVPMPDAFAIWRPEWVALVVVYWVIALPQRVGLFTAWVTGFFVDVIEGSLLGLNAIALMLVAYVALSLYQRLRMFTVLQQSITILMLTGVCQLLTFWVLTATSQNTPPNLLFVMSAVSSAIAWPFVFVVLRFWRRTLAIR